MKPEFRSGLVQSRGLAHLAEDSGLKWISACDHSSGNKEADMGVIPAAVGTLSSNYPRRDKKNPALYQYVQQVMRGLPGTPCCVQMSHALNMSGIQIPANSYRRRNTPLTINGTVYYYIPATDELEKFLFEYCGDGTERKSCRATWPRTFSSVARGVLMWDTNDPARWLVDYMKTQS
jgi:hypothetical protein